MKTNGNLAEVIKEWHGCVASLFIVFTCFIIFSTYVYTFMLYNVMFGIDIFQYLTTSDYFHLNLSNVIPAAVTGLFIVMNNSFYYGKIIIEASKPKRKYYIAFLIIGLLLVASLFISVRFENFKAFITISLVILIFASLFISDKKHAIVRSIIKSFIVFISFISIFASIEYERIVTEKNINVNHITFTNNGYPGIEAADTSLISLSENYAFLYKKETRTIIIIPSAAIARIEYQASGAEILIKRLKKILF